MVGFSSSSANMSDRDPISFYEKITLLISKNRKNTIESGITAILYDFQI